MSRYRQEAQKWLGELKTACEDQLTSREISAGVQGGIRFDPEANTYTITSPPPDLRMSDNEIDFSYPEPSSEMWQIYDELHFAHKTLYGDGSITARIESIDNPYWQIMVGVMIRNTLEPSSENVAVFITPTGRVVSQYRVKQWEATQRVLSDANNIDLPCWVRLTRRGNRVVPQHSSDGTNWHTVQDENSNQDSFIGISMDETVHTGLAITSGSPTLRTRARMSHVTVTGEVKPDGPFVRSNAINLFKASSTTSH